MKIQEHLDNLEEAIIRDYYFDILNNKICMKLEWIDGDYSKWHNLEIQDISCFYFSNASKKRRKDIVRWEDDDVFELTSMYTLTDDVDITIKHHSDNEHWLTQFDGAGNISVEIWDMLLILEAKYIQIDNDRYELY